MKKIMIISDIHGSVKYLKSALKVFQDENFERLIILGDLYYHGPRNSFPEGYDCQECAQLLNVNKDKILVIRGNCDAEVDQTISEFVLSDNLHFQFGKLCIFADHGQHHGPENLPSENWDVYLYGHYHLTNLVDIGGRIVASPGSIALPRDGVRGYLTIDEEGVLVLFNLATGEKIKKLSL